MNGTTDIDDLSAAFAQQNLHHLPTSKIMGMTQEERLQALQDLHGVLDLEGEHSDVVPTKLAEMDKLLAQWDPSQRDAFDQAAKRSSAYVKRLRLTFLRAEAFDAAKASRRMVAHFESRLTFFETEDVLGRDIKLSDLSSRNEDIPLFQSGAIQLLKQPDRAGRSIILVCPGKYPYLPYHFPSLGRFILMISMMAAHTLGKEGQQRGAIVVWIGHGAVVTRPFYDGLWGNNGLKHLSLFSASPIQIRAVHVCHDNRLMTKIWDRMMAAATPHQAVRFQSHFGTLSSCLQSLRRYGIPKEILPLDEQGNLDGSDFRERVLLYQSELDDGGDNYQIAESPARDASVLRPLCSDILLGKGKRSDKFRGNQLFRKAIAENYDAYNSSSDRRGKLAILRLVYFHLLQSGCRFLIPVQGGESGDPGEWMEIPEEQALEKISMGIRNYRRKGTVVGRREAVVE